ncbi:MULTISPECIES: ABC transporter substrate-binding protein [unclassified Legionella]|uniref:ABC transporter substrate-binding protein n=1 Tax=unclassified Legionella TaxID=2622702 RepID=UPI001056288B|nr:MULTISPECIES: ABC transporter substrate-binding protein [unclassified Legionella]MDI9819226.1 ABC transporter substrate-binding protein [Legionella sp. PL877]
MIKAIIPSKSFGNLLVGLWGISSLIFMTSPFAARTICLTGRIVESIGSYGQSFHRAAEMALEENNNLKNKIQLKYYFYDNKPLQPIHIYHKMLDDDCSAIIGFEYLSDLLLVIKEQRTTNIPIFTSYASFLSTDKIPNNVFVFMPTYDDHAATMVEFLEKKFADLSDLLLITEVNREEMLKYKKAYLKELFKRNIQFYSYDFLTNDPLFLEKLKKYMKNKKYRHVVLLSSATTSAKIVDFLKSLDVVYIGTENFGSTVSPSFYTRLTNKNINAYFIRNLDYIKSGKKLSSYKEKYVLRFKSLPTVMSAYTYDAVNIILKAFMQTGSMDTDNIYKINHRGITGAYIKNHKFFRSNKYTVLSVYADGYHYEK